VAIAILRQQQAKKTHCPVDDWDFDARYTDGACPICGWRPEGSAVAAVPAWRQQLARVPWDYVGLGFLFVVLVALGIFVALAAKINIVPS
jgi:hypothetical protein